VKWLEARAAFVQGRADLQLGHPHDALPLLQRAVELRKSTVDADSPLLAMAQVALGDCYLDLGENTKANEVAADAKRAFISHREIGTQYLRPWQNLEKRLRQVTLTAKHA
jgi:tetratricopeptide (TPR) repeat protein